MLTAFCFKEIYYKCERKIPIIIPKVPKGQLCTLYSGMLKAVLVIQACKYSAVSMLQNISREKQRKNKKKELFLFSSFKNTHSPPTSLDILELFSGCNAFECNHSGRYTTLNFLDGKVVLI